MSQSEAMSENEAAEGGVVFEELSAVRSNVVDRGSSSEGACKAPGILLASGRRGILEEVTYGICSSGEWEVGFRGDEGREAKHGGEDNHKERGIVGLAGAKDALDAERSVTHGEAPDSGEE